MQNSEEDEGFVYKPSNDLVSPQNEEEESDDEHFVYKPSDGALEEQSSPSHPEPTISPEPQREQSPEPAPAALTEPEPIPAPPSPLPLSRVEHEKIYAAATSGDLDLLQRLIQAAVADERATVFALVNEPSPRTGLTLLHLSASRGHYDVVQWRE